VAQGVGHIPTATAQPNLFGRFLPSPEQVSVVSKDAFAAFGVGHIPALAITAKMLHVFRPMRAFIAICPSNVFPSSFATDVGNNPDPVSPVRSTNGGSGYTMPLRIIPERSEAPEHDIQSARAKGRDVFDDDPARRDFLDDAEVFEPEAGTLAGEAGASSCDAEVLAGKAPAYQIDGACFLRNHQAIESPNIVMDGHLGPMLREHLPAKRVKFAEHRGGHAGAFQPKAEPAYATEQVQDPHFRPNFWNA
jgi:hypothetical protein